MRQEESGYTVNGSSPGPELEATVGDLVEVTLVNDNVADGTTLHWHGVDVPNAAVGLAGVTQDVVAPGEEYTYRFVADQAGTFWYHSHQMSHEQVRQGLLGALVVHCHTLPHAAEGLVAHLVYEGVTSSFSVGGDHGNEPE